MGDSRILPNRGFQSNHRIRANPQGLDSRYLRPQPSRAKVLAYSTTAGRACAVCHKSASGRAGLCGLQLGSQDLTSATGCDTMAGNRPAESRRKGGQGMARRAMTQIIKARVETPIAHKIVDVAEKDRTTVSDIVRDALAEYLDRR